MKFSVNTTSQIRINPEMPFPVNNPCGISIFPPRDAQAARPPRQPELATAATAGQTWCSRQQVTLAVVLSPRPMLRSQMPWGTGRIRIEARATGPGPTRVARAPGESLRPKFEPWGWACQGLQTLWNSNQASKPSIKFGPKSIPSIKFGCMEYIYLANLMQTWCKPSMQTVGEPVSSRSLDSGSSSVAMTVKFPTPGPRARASGSSAVLLLELGLPGWVPVTVSEAAAQDSWLASPAAKRPSRCQVASRARRPGRGPVTCGHASGHSDGACSVQPEARWFLHLCMHIACGGELASEGLGAAEGVLGLNDGAAPTVTGKVGRTSNGRRCAHTRACSACSSLLAPRHPCPRLHP